MFSHSGNSGKESTRCHYQRRGLPERVIQIPPLMAPGSSNEADRTGQGTSTAHLECRGPPPPPLAWGRRRATANKGEKAEGALVAGGHCHCRPIRLRQRHGRGPRLHGTEASMHIGARPRASPVSAATLQISGPVVSSVLGRVEKTLEKCGVSGCAEGFPAFAVSDVRGAFGLSGIRKLGEKRRCAKSSRPLSATLSLSDAHRRDGAGPSNEDRIAPRARSRAAAC